MTRSLSLATLDRLPADVARPAYAPRDVGIGIVHLGIGAFHRAHQAVYTDAALAAAGGPWGICGVSLRSAGVRDRLVP
ncbi:MAG TPA: mannitol dehydrogenase family protein, partial [Casimicrobiaceae bacterium]